MMICSPLNSLACRVDHVMAVETTYSPRFSFSYDPCHPESPNNVAVASDIQLGPEIDFEFLINKSSEFEQSSADDLFSNGEILAIGVRRKKQRNLPPKLLLGEPVTPPKTCPSPSRAMAHHRHVVHGITGPTLAKLMEMEEPNESLDCSLLRKLSRSISTSSAGSNKSTSSWYIPLMLRSYSTGGSEVDSGSKTGNLQDQKKYKKPSSLSYPKKKKIKKSFTNCQVNDRISPALNVPLADVFSCGLSCLNMKC